ncbi:unnamed protein product [Caenorhabditis brenneri]
MYQATLTAVQTGVQDTSCWDHFEAESHLHLQMETKFLPHVSILFAALMLAWYFDTFDFRFFKYTAKKKGDAVDELLKKKHQVIGKECIPETTTCFLIVDSYYLENGRLTTKRDLLLEENTEYSLTGVEVESAKPVSWENLNSRDWAVNKVVINSRYARLLVASGFIMEVRDVLSRVFGRDYEFEWLAKIIDKVNEYRRISNNSMQHNPNAQPQQLLNVHRPHQIQPPGAHRIPPQNQQVIQQTQMQQGQQNMGQPQMQQHHQQHQQPPQHRTVIQQPGSSNQHQMQSQQGQMMGQQMRNQQNQPQQQMMQNQQQSQMRGNPQQQMRNMPQQGQQIQQQPQMGHMRMQQGHQNVNSPNQQQQMMPMQGMQQNQQNITPPNQQQQRMPMQSMQQNPQNATPPNQQQHRMPVQNMQPRPPQQNPRMQPPPQHQIQHQSGAQNMNRPSPQSHQMQQGVPQNINRPPSQQMQHGAPQGMNRPSPQMSNMPNLHHIMNRPGMQMPQSEMNDVPEQQQQYRHQSMQQVQRTHQNVNISTPPHEHQRQDMGGQQHQQMRMQQQQQHDPQIQQGPTGPQQQPIRVAQVFQVGNQQNVQQQHVQQQNVQHQQRQQIPQQQHQVHRGQMQDSPQNAQMRMNQPQQQQSHQQNLQQGNYPGRNNPPMAQVPQMNSNQQRPMQQGSSQQQHQPQVIQQPQPIQPPQTMHHPQTVQQESLPINQDVVFKQDSSTIRINGEHAIINGMQYKLVQLPQEPDNSQQGQMPPGHHNQQGTSVQQHHQGQQQASNMPQHGQNNQMPMQQQHQSVQQQHNMQNRPLTPNQPTRQNQGNMQNQQNQGNMQHQQTPPAIQPQQPAPSKAKPRSRAKKNNAAAAASAAPELIPVSQQNNTMLDNSMTPSTSMQMAPSTSGPSSGKRKILPPSLTPINPQTPPQNERNDTMPSQQVQMVQQGKNMVQVGGFPPNRQMNTPMKNNSRHLTPTKQGILQRPNGRIQQAIISRTPIPLRKKPENKENMAEMQDAILSHINGTRKMTPEYAEYVDDELNRILNEMEKVGLMGDDRYLSVHKLLVLVRGNNIEKIRISGIPPIERSQIRSNMHEGLMLENETSDETPEDRKKRCDGYLAMLLDAYPEKVYPMKFAELDEEIIKKEKVFYREQDMKVREAYLRKTFDKIPEEKKLQAKIEYLSLGLYDFQKELRNQVKEMTTLVPPTEFLINPWSIRRTKLEYQLELKQHPDRALLEKKRKSTNYFFLQGLIKHAREFKEFHKRNLANHTKVRKAMQTYISNEAKRIAREEMKNERIRIQKLIQEDEEGYRAMLDDKKDRRLVYLLEQTDDYIKSLCDLLKKQQDSTGCLPARPAPQKEYDGLADEDKVQSILEKARNDQDEYDDKSNGTSKMNVEDYYTTAHGVREEITQQHHMMGGGNPNLKLKPYQLKGLEWMVSLYNNNLNGILADEMGLGKTIQTIAFITYLMEIKKSSGPFLVIVPLSTIPNWQNEFEKWAPNVHLIVYKGTKDVRKINEPIIKSGKFNVLLTTFEYVIREKGLLGKLRWKYMMIDEGHRLKNQHCKLTEMLNTRFQCPRRLLITGTPLQNKLPELWALLNFLLPSIFSSCSSFEQWFNAPFATTGEKVELTSEETMLIIRRLHKVLRPFLLRRLKKEVESELPDKMEFVIKCEMSGLQKVLYKHMQKGLLLDGKTNTGSRSLMNTMVHLRKLCNHPFLFENVEDSCRIYWDSKYISAVDLYRVSGKLELLDRILPKLQATNHRVLMFFQMTAMMTVVEDYLAGTSINYLRLDGSTKPDERGLLLDQFNAPNSKFFLFMLSTRAGGLGLNLQTADTVIIFDSDWNPHQDMQAQDRAHRIGQKAEVRVFRLITANSVEEKILASARFKLNVDEKVIQAGKFDNRSTGAERRQILENIIKAENENDEDEEVPNDEEINDILSRSEEEFELFQKMDQERIDQDERSNAKPRLCGDDEIPKDILRAADETDYIEKAKEEGLVTHLEVLPGSRRNRKEVDYSTDTMSDDKFLEKLFDADEPSKQEATSDLKPVTIKPDTQNVHSVEPKVSTLEKPAVGEEVTPPKLPTLKVPRSIIKLAGEELKRKLASVEDDNEEISPRKMKKKDYDFTEERKKHKKEKERRKEDAENIIQIPIQKIKIKFGGQALERNAAFEDELISKQKAYNYHISSNESTPKKKKHRDRDDGEGSSEKKKKHKHKHHRHDEDSPTRHKKYKESPKKTDKYAFTKPDATESPSKSEEKKSDVFDNFAVPRLPVKISPSKNLNSSADASPVKSNDLVSPSKKGTSKFLDNLLFAKLEKDASSKSAEKKTPEKPMDAESPPKSTSSLKIRLSLKPKDLLSTSAEKETSSKLAETVPSADAKQSPFKSFDMDKIVKPEEENLPMRSLKINFGSSPSKSKEKRESSESAEKESPMMSLKIRFDSRTDVKETPSNLSSVVVPNPFKTPMKLDALKPQEDGTPAKSFTMESPIKLMQTLKKDMASMDSPKKDSPLKIKLKLDTSIKQILESTPPAPEPVKNHPPLKLRLKLPVPLSAFTSPAVAVKTDDTPNTSICTESSSSLDNHCYYEEQLLKGRKKNRDHKDRKERRELKRKSHEGVTEEERLLRKEAKRLKKEAKEGQSEQSRRQEKAARKAARKEQQRLSKEAPEKTEEPVIEPAAGSA